MKSHNLENGKNASLSFSDKRIQGSSPCGYDKNKNTTANPLKDTVGKLVDKVKQGKKNRKKGGEFELEVRKDLMAKGWIVTKFDNDVEFDKITEVKMGDETVKWDAKVLQLHGIEVNAVLKQAKKSFNPFTKRVGYGNGFPDFLCFKETGIDVKFANKTLTTKDFKISDPIWVIRLIEAKSNGYLNPEERAKIEWLKKNKNIPIFVAKKGIKKEIIYTEL